MSREPLAAYAFDGNGFAQTWPPPRAFELP